MLLNGTGKRFLPAFPQQFHPQQLDLRLEARSNKNFPAADAIRDALMTQGVEIMDGDPLRWDWRITA